LLARKRCVARLRHASTLLRTLPVGTAKSAPIPGELEIASGLSGIASEATDGVSQPAPSGYRRNNENALMLG
jgi:hypothetical protein